MSEVPAKVEILTIGWFFLFTFVLPGSELSSTGSRQYRRKTTALLGLGLLVEFSSHQLQEMFLENCSVVEDIYSHLMQRVQQVPDRSEGPAGTR